LRSCAEDLVFNLKRSDNPLFGDDQPCGKEQRIAQEHAAPKPVAGGMSSGVEQIHSSAAEERPTELVTKEKARRTRNEEPAW
jgi:hypothetical protein